MKIRLNLISGLATCQPSFIFVVKSEVRVWGGRKARPQTELRFEVAEGWEGPSPKAKLVGRLPCFKNIALKYFIAYKINIKIH